MLNLKNIKSEAGFTLIELLASTIITGTVLAGSAALVAQYSYFFEQDFIITQLNSASSRLLTSIHDVINRSSFYVDVNDANLYYPNIISNGNAIEVAIFDYPEPEDNPAVNFSVSDQVKGANIPIIGEIRLDNGEVHFLGKSSNDRVALDYLYQKEKVLLDRDIREGRADGRKIDYLYNPSYNQAVYFKNILEDNTEGEKYEIKVETLKFSRYISEAFSDPESVVKSNPVLSYSPRDPMFSFSGLIKYWFEVSANLDREGRGSFGNNQTDYFTGSRFNNPNNNGLDGFVIEFFSLSGCQIPNGLTNSQNVTTTSYESVCPGGC